MKKLMIAAAAAAMIGGVQADSTCSDGPGAPCEVCKKQTLVYQWQFKGKTGAGVLVKGKSSTETTQGGTCSDGSSVVTPGCDEVIRVPGSLAIIGYTYHCDAECNAFDNNGQNQLAKPWKYQYYGTKPMTSLVAPYRYYNGNNADLGTSFIDQVTVAHIIGKTATQYELAGVAKFVFPATGKYNDLVSGRNDEVYSDLDQEYVLTFAGFGSYDKKNYRVNSVSGNFAGTQKPPRYSRSYTNCATGKLERCPAADYWNCCPGDCAGYNYVDPEYGKVGYAYAGFPKDASVAYGSWSVKFNSSATKKFNANPTTYWVK